MACSINCKIEITHHFGVLNLKALVSVFAPHRPFQHKFHKSYMFQFLHIKVFGLYNPIFCTSKFLVMKSSFLHFKFFVHKFTLHHTDGPHHMMPPQKFMISAQHWYTVQKEFSVAANPGHSTSFEVLTLFLA